MKCPNCKINVELTWLRYFKNPFARFYCPECSSKFKVVRPFSFYVFVAITTIIYLGAVISIFIIKGTEDLWQNFAIVSIIYFVVYISIEKKLKSNYATKKI